jgi:PHD/YefM family antitoxin component YafN of YafNO toxin-antitoxin module
VDAVLSLQSPLICAERNYLQALLDSAKHCEELDETAYDGTQAVVQERSHNNSRRALAICSE